MKIEKSVLYEADSFIIEYLDGAVILTSKEGLEIRLNSGSWHIISSKIQALENARTNPAKEFTMYPMFEDD